MKKLVLPLFVATATLFAGAALLSACESSSTEGEGDEGEGDEGEGDEGEGDEGEGDEGGGVLGDTCSADADCDAGFVCGTFFQGDQVPKACLPSCAEANAACTVSAGVEGTCQQFPNVSSPVCFAQAPLLGLCGNGVSSGCAPVNGAAVNCAIARADNAQTPVDDRIVGLCIIPCSADAVCTDATLACSDDARVDFGAGPVGVCVAPTTVDQACGANPDGSTTVCTGDQTCSAIAAQTPTGTCEADAGGEGEGEGEGDAP